MLCLPANSHPEELGQSWSNRLHGFWLHIFSHYFPSSGCSYCCRTCSSSSQVIRAACWSWTQWLHSCYFLKLVSQSSWRSAGEQSTNSISPSCAVVGQGARWNSVELWGWAHTMGLGKQNSSVATWISSFHLLLPEAQFAYLTRKNSTMCMLDWDVLQGSWPADAVATVHCGRHHACPAARAGFLHWSHVSTSTT